MPLDIYFSHSLNRNDYASFREVFRLCREQGLEITFLEEDSKRATVTPEVQSAINQSALVLAFVSRRGLNISTVIQEIECAKRNQKKVLVVAERGLQTKEFQESRNVIPFDARYPIDTVKRSVSIVRDLRLKREDTERVKGLVGMLVFLKVLTFFGGSK